MDNSKSAIKLIFQNAHAQEIVSVLLEVNHVPVSQNPKLLTHANVEMLVNALIAERSVNADHSQKKKLFLNVN
jgi:hypothetical protein